MTGVNCTHTVADFGCGTGRGALYIHSVTDAAVKAIDFAESALDGEARKFLGEKFRFLKHDITQPLDEKFDYGYCTDVMEGSGVWHAGHERAAVAKGAW